ncbi:MAG: two-component regulator propeller domain-containing protein [Verrucomicrobiota bacterium]|nr:histidine kinase [Limisphaera sp.]MDW8380754.1 two-component regulator propeller domain-containing protein [Verrucomicrobiota bacterium]
MKWQQGRRSKTWATWLQVGWLYAVAAVRAAVTSPPDSPFLVENWSTGEGLPQSSVLTVIQDQNGYLWAGTLNGLVRFDGRRFTVFDSVNTPGLESSRIVLLHEDREGNFWIGTENAGVFWARPDGLRRVDIGRRTRDGCLRAVVQDRVGAVWFYTADGQLGRLYNGQMNIWRLGTELPSYCRSLAVETDRLWVGSDQQLAAVSPVDRITPPDLPVSLVVPVRRLDLLLSSRTGGHWRLVEGRIMLCRGNEVIRDLGPYPWRSNARPSAACEDLEGNLIVGTLDESSGDGVYWFDPEGQFTRLGASDGLAAEGILALTMDREGNLWVGTDGGGLHRVRKKRFRREVLPNAVVAQSVCCDPEGNVWMGFTRGLALRTRDVLVLFGPDHGLVTPYEQNVSAVWVDHQRQVWVGTGSGLFRRTGERFERVPGPAALLTAISAIAEDHAGRLWFGTQAGLVSYHQGRWHWWRSPEGLGSEPVRAITPDNQDGLWVGTVGGGLYRIEHGRVERWARSGSGLPVDDIACLWLDRMGNVWIGTPGHGLILFGQGQWRRFTTRDGLPGNSVSYLLQDQEDALWIGSNGGLLRLPRQMWEAVSQGAQTQLVGRVYGPADGLPTTECTQGSQPAAAVGTDGRLWFATVKGVVSVHPQELRPNLSPPPVVIESIWLDGNPVWIRGLRSQEPPLCTVPPGQRRLEIHFTSLSLSAADRARFEHRLLGYDNTWTGADSSRSVRYARLPPGQYQFEIRAANEDGVWSLAPARLSITVQPPLWRKPWFLAAAIVVVTASVVGTVHWISTARLRRQLRHQQALERERARIARDLHDQLGANLVQVALLSELLETDKHNPTEVETHARQITETARETTRALDEIVWATNPAHDSLEGLVNYVCKYAQEYLALAGLRYRLDVPPLPDRSLPPEVRHNVYLAAKEAIHNAVKHARAQCLHVRLRLDNERAVLEIQDDGRGLPGDALDRGRHGLVNMQKRMQEIGGRFEIVSQTGQGTTVRLEFPTARLGS